MLRDNLVELIEPMRNSAGADPLALGIYQQKPASDDSLSCLENPRPEGAESSLTDNVTSPFPAEPRQNDTGVLHDAANLRKWRVNSQTPMVTGSLRSLLDFLVCGRRYPRNVERWKFEMTAQALKYHP